MKNHTLSRVNSIDIFRALTMFLMLFVNDFWTLTNVPHWMEHSKADVDFLGFSDVIFPLFLFIVGMVIPYAIDIRRQRGQSQLVISRHIIERSFALIIMGIFTVNSPSIDPAATGLSKAWFEIIMVIGCFLIWNKYRTDSGRNTINTILRIAGILLLIGLAVLFRAKGGDGTVQYLAPRWWGILGLIGWSYLTVALYYLLVGKSFFWNVIGWLFFTFFNLAGHAGWLTSILGLPSGEVFIGNGAFHSFVFAGVLGGLLLQKLQTGNWRKMIGYTIVIGIMFLLIGIAAREFFIISKIRATPTWIYLCTGIGFISFAFIYWIVDILGKRHWFKSIEPAGHSTLTCYILPYWFYSFVTILGLQLPSMLTNGVIGLGKSLVYSLLIIGITVLIGRVGLRLKL